MALSASAATERDALQSQLASMTQRMAHARETAEALREERARAAAAESEATHLQRELTQAERAVATLEGRLQSVNLEVEQLQGGCADPGTWDRARLDAGGWSLMS